MRIKKTTEEREKIQKFTENFGELFYSYAFDHPEADIQKIFDEMKDQLYTNSGTIYLCFSCGKILKRNEIEIQSFFQLKQVWHDCQGTKNNMSYPTAGIVTRWGMVLRYIENNPQIIN